LTEKVGVLGKGQKVYFSARSGKKQILRRLKKCRLKLEFAIGKRWVTEVGGPENDACR
jgi:hypothetical protein